MTSGAVSGAASCCRSLFGAEAADLLVLARRGRASTLQIALRGWIQRTDPVRCVFPGCFEKNWQVLVLASGPPRAPPSLTAPPADADAVDLEPVRRQPPALSARNGDYTSRDRRSRRARSRRRL